jgi:hypothetical protein
MTVSGDHVQHLEGLIAALGSQGAAARLLGTESSRVSEWLHGVRPRRGTVQRIAQAAAAVDALRGRTRGGVDELRSALETPLPELGGSSPVELIEQGRGAEVVRVLAGEMQSTGRGAVERDLAAALVELATAARRSAEALTAARDAWIGKRSAS